MLILDSSLYFVAYLVLTRYGTLEYISGFTVAHGHKAINYLTHVYIRRLH